MSKTYFLPPPIPPLPTGFIELFPKDKNSPCEKAKFLVCHSYGSCMYQDHNCDWQWFETRHEAEAHIEFLKKQDSDVSWVIVEGRHISSG